MNDIIERIEAEIEGTRKAFRDHPDRYSAYGGAYWDGNTAALQWVLSMMRENQSLDSTLKGENK